MDGPPGAFLLAHNTNKRRQRLQCANQRKRWLQSANQRRRRATSCTECRSRLQLQAVADGVFYAELNELLMRELGGEGYSGVEVSAGRGWVGAAVTIFLLARHCSAYKASVGQPHRLCYCRVSQVRVTPMRTEVIIRATRTQNVLGEPEAPVGCGTRLGPGACGTRLGAELAYRCWGSTKRCRQHNWNPEVVGWPPGNC